MKVFFSLLTIVVLATSCGKTPDPQIVGGQLNLAGNTQIPLPISSEKALNLEGTTIYLDGAALIVKNAGEAVFTIEHHHLVIMDGQSFRADKIKVDGKMICVGGEAFRQNITSDGRIVYSQATFLEQHWKNLVALLFCLLFSIWLMQLGGECIGFLNSFSFQH